LKALAPIGISTYSRINHLKKTIEGLQNNTLAKESELYIFSDAPKRGDEEIVERVRKYLHTIDGFKKVHVAERKTNGRVLNNRGGIQQLLDKYGKMIFLEDDIVTAPGFLQFMNDALNFYEKNEEILSISGYSPPIHIPQNYKKDYYALRRFRPWGFATWKHKFNPFGFEIENLCEFFKDRSGKKELSKYGEELYWVLMSRYLTNQDALDIKVNFYLYKQNMKVIYPTESLVLNIGNDKSGVSNSSGKKYDTTLSTKDSFIFTNDISENDAILSETYMHSKINIKSKLIVFIKYLLKSKDCSK
jgi:hypothetical protein